MQPQCGNGVVEGNEACDDGAANSDTVADACRTGCTMPRCGDGAVDSGEGCDDGNLENGDGCSDCVPDCGNGRVEQSEVCDPAVVVTTTCEERNLVSGTLGCTANCVYDTTGCAAQPVCGNSIPEGNEACDDGNAVPGDGCTAACELDLPPGWSCDPTWFGTADGCDCGCGLTDPDCPDTNVGSCEWCNLQGSCGASSGSCPANIDATDNATCVGCGDGQVQGSEACDDGANNGVQPDACRANCVLPRCGDKVVDTGETCDDGNRVDSDGCSNLCQL